MKRPIAFVSLLILLVALALPEIALAKGLSDDKVVAGGDYTLGSGETLNGNLLVLGGAVLLEEESRVHGDVVAFGGSLDIDGEVEGDVLGMGASVSLGKTARVEGDLTTLGASLTREEGSRVDGQVITSLQEPFQFTLPGNIYVPDFSRFEAAFSPVWGGLWFFFRTFLWAGLAVLLVMFLPTPTQRTAEAVVSQPLIAGGVGLLTTIVAPLLFIGIAITIILIPISVAGILVMAVAWFIGRIALGLEVGRRLEQMFKQDWPLAVSAGIGTFVLTLVVDGAAEMIQCAGWLFPVLIGVLGLGGVILTRFGTQPYLPVTSYPPVSAVPLGRAEGQTERDESQEV